jgi:hypothetical protein
MYCSVRTKDVERFIDAPDTPKKAFQSRKIDGIEIFFKGRYR